MPATESTFASAPNSVIQQSGYDAYWISIVANFRYFHCPKSFKTISYFLKSQEFADEFVLILFHPYEVFEAMHMIMANMLKYD